MASAAALGMALVSPAYAQAADPNPDGIQDIVVYAQKKARGEQLQKVPMAISAIDSKTIEASHAIDIRDIGRLVPNAQLDGVGTFPGFANFFMRGVGVSTSVRSLDPAVNIIQDGMVIGYQAGAVLDTFDTEGWRCCVVRRACCSAATHRAVPSACAASAPPARAKRRSRSPWAMRTRSRPGPGWRPPSSRTRSSRASRC
ncbi:TonB-dependent receptor plug domain-containing protein [Rhizorhabdus histidinilytica]